MVFPHLVACVDATSANPNDTRLRFLKSPFVSYGGLGRVVKQHGRNFDVTPHETIAYMNTNTPSSTMICGVQGSGKSHTVSIMLENSLVSSPELGVLPRPLSAVVFHLGASQSHHLPCESAYLGSAAAGKTIGRRVPVKVLVSPSNFKTMKEVYSATKAEVVPFYLSTKDLNCTRMLSLMHVSEGERVPLYMEVVQHLLRSMGNDNFDYRSFKKALEKKKDSDFTRQQTMPLDLRLELLEAMLVECKPSGKSTKHSGSIKEHYKHGTVTIVDLTDPFINSSSACALFDIALSLYLDADLQCGKLLVLDEAHKVCSEIWMHLTVLVVPHKRNCQPICGVHHLSYQTTETSRYSHSHFNSGAHRHTSKYTWSMLHHHLSSI
jgi:hypothetical protein